MGYNLHLEKIFNKIPKDKIELRKIELSLTDDFKKQKESKKETAPEELEQKESKKEDALVVVEENPVKNLKAEETKDLEKPILKD